MSQDLDPHLKFVDKELSDLEHLSYDERQSLYDELIKDKTPEEIKIFLENAKKEFDELEGKLKRESDGLKNLSRTGEQSDSERARNRDQKKAIREAIKELNLFEKEFGLECQETAANKAEHYRDLTQGQDMNISTLNLGEPYEFKLAGNALLTADAALNQATPAATAETPLADPANPEAEGQTPPAASANPQDPPVNAAGEVVVDVNQDGVMNYKDLAASQPDPLTGQKIFINTGNQHWELASADAANGDYTFKVSGGGKSSFVHFTGAKFANFFFNQGLTKEDLSTIQSTWPPDFLKHVYQGMDPKSLYEHFNPSFENPADRLKVIKGYKTATSQTTLDAINAEMGTNVDYTNYTKALDAFFKGIDDPTQDRTEIAKQILEFADDDTLLAMTMGLMKTGDTASKYLEMLAPAVPQIEARVLGNTDPMLDETTAPDSATVPDAAAAVGELAGPTAPTKTLSVNNVVLLCILESTTNAAGQFGGNIWETGFAHGGVPAPTTPGEMPDASAAMAANPTGAEPTNMGQLYYTPGQLPNHATNIAAINKFKQIASENGLPLTGHEVEAIKCEKGPFVMDMEANPLGPPESGKDGDKYSTAGKAAVIGGSTLVGAGIGFTVAGPYGAIAGAVIGAGVGVVEAFDLW